MKLGRVLLGLSLTTLLGAQEASTPPKASPLHVRATVCNAAGQPLGDAGIVIGPADVITTTEALSRPQAKSAGNGTLELEVPVAPRDVYTATALLIAAPGKVAFCVPNLPVLIHRGAVHDECVLDLGEIRLPDGFTLSGRVRGPDGKPIRGARIRAVDSLTTYPWFSPCYGSQATTAESGVFLLRGVFANAMTVTVAADGYYSRTLPAMDLAAPFDVQLEASGFVEGMVLDEAGKPFDALVVATHEFMDAECPPVRSRQGKFRLGVT